jgi:hypothetical protein
VSATLLRRLFLIGTPLALAIVLLFHPAGGDNGYADVRDDVDAWLFVHTATLLLTPLLGLAGFWLLSGLQNRAAIVSRVALVSFLVFYTAFEVTVGIGRGILVDYANGLPSTEQAVVADAIQDYTGNAIAGEPTSVALIAGALGWILAMLAAAFAFRQAGASWAITLLIAGAALFAAHPPPFGPIGLACFIAAAVLVERWRSHASEPESVSARPSRLSPPHGGPAV